MIGFQVVVYVWVIVLAGCVLLYLLAILLGYHIGRPVWLHPWWIRDERVLGCDRKCDGIFILVVTLYAMAYSWWLREVIGRCYSQGGGKELHWSQQPDGRPGVGHTMGVIAMTSYILSHRSIRNHL